MESIFLYGSDKSTYVSSLLSIGEKEQIHQVILHNMDVFAWTHSNMIGINPEHASQKLNVIPSTKPVRQKGSVSTWTVTRLFRQKWIFFLKEGFIRELKYPEWLANEVVVMKKGSKWRVYVDYTDLNEACPKDNFPLPLIDQIVDVSIRHGMLSFLDAFSGYHQILMHPPDAEKTTFITPYGLLCYNVMPFG